jgi:hypothetical protein
MALTRYNYMELERDNGSIKYLVHMQKGPPHQGAASSEPRLVDQTQAFEVHVPPKK